MRDHIFFYLNGRKVQAKGRDAFAMLAPYLRRERGLTGTKIACAHGACGSCSVLVGRPAKDGFEYQTLNSCIYPIFACDGAHIITVEGLNGPGSVGGGDDGILSPVQDAMVRCHGTQCGFCTPGIVVTLTALHDKRPSCSLEEVRAALEGNLCRCTGYSQILEAGTSVETADLRPLAELYSASSICAELEAGTAQSVEIEVPADELEGAQHLFVPKSPEEAARWNASHPDATIVAGGTEIGVLMSVKGAVPDEILCLSGLDGWDEVHEEDGHLVLGARATWTQVAAQVGDIVPEFCTLLKKWGSPQIRNAGTVAGNIVRASPISDSLPFLMVSEAELEFVHAEGERRQSILEYLDGEPEVGGHELLRRVRAPLAKDNQTLRLFKVSKRRTFDRSIVSAAFLLTERDGRIEELRIAMGGVARLTVRLPNTEAFLRGKPLSAATWREAAAVLRAEISPISDASASSEHRLRLAANLLLKFGAQLGAPSS